LRGIGSVALWRIAERMQEGVNGGEKTHRRGGAKMHQLA
jgi:hypothetical protein